MKLSREYTAHAERAGIRSCLLLSLGGGRYRAAQHRGASVRGGSARRRHGGMSGPEHLGVGLVRLEDYVAVHGDSIGAIAVKSGRRQYRAGSTAWLVEEGCRRCGLAQE